MGEPVTIDRKKRIAAFERLRREQVIAEASLTPEERILAADELVRAARAQRADADAEPAAPPGRPRRAPR